MKRLRFAIHPVQIRFYGVGEYGDNTQRPHYHVIIFGLGLNDTRAVNEAWNLGHCHFGSVSRESCQYVAGYVTKKMNKATDPRLLGREPEFALMSRNPGIGYKAAVQIGQQMTKSSGAAQWINTNGDVPQITRMEGRNMPLGRYMTGKVRQACGFENENSPPEKAKEYLAGMQALQKTLGPHVYQASKPFVDWAKSEAVTRPRVKQSRRTL